MKRKTEESVEVDALPACDFCEDTAEVHGKTWLGSLANMCRRCFWINGVGLAPGEGHRWVLRSSS